METVMKLMSRAVYNNMSSTLEGGQVGTYVNE